ncbi:hypothetical protein CR205_12780 [Alteribacter lacisalsi]|uniref:DinB family protein n=2 Tax=Alteribacter lacisalsi TaxID=2045244 RepID=A0A2W0H8E3_9BACI|nr:hypothetical protein CR205_12780 [Alteribacter lacisalsi]
MEHHFSRIYEQRDHFLTKTRPLHDRVWTRPQPEKWSIGETYYHLYLMVKRLRQLNNIYLPLLSPIAKRKKKEGFPKQSEDIYTLYKKKNGKSMRSPFVLLPPKNAKDRMTFHHLVGCTSRETRKLEAQVLSLNEAAAGHIRYPDPLAHYPNIFQSIDLLGIHERHHFQLCERYYQLN